MLTSVIISPQADRSGELSAKLTEFGRVRVLRTYQEYPSEEDLCRFLQVAGPAIIFLGAEDTRRALRLAVAIDREGTGAQVVVLSKARDPQVLVESMQVGIREFLSLPLEPDRVNEAVCRIAEVLDRKPLTFKSTDAVFSFLPAKPGDGASTVALNVSSAMARCSPGKTLLADLDLNHGMISFLLKITNGRSILDALDVAYRLDDSVWDNLILKCDSMDVLCSGRLEQRQEIDLAGAEKILHFARRTYSAICLDLSGNMEPFSIPLLAQSREIFLVSTPDVPSLHFARAKAQFLRGSGFEERSSVIVNRTEIANPFSVAELEKLLGLRVRTSFQSDPRRIGSAMNAGAAVNPKSSLGRQFETLAKNLLRSDAGSGASSVASPRRRRLIEYFALVPSSEPVMEEKRR